MPAAESEVRQPFFVILGAPKCGTTAIAQAVAAHPDLQLSRPKEPHFFDARYEKGLGCYLREHFPGREAKRAAGEATPSYLALPWVPRRIAATFPHARLVAILRHPVERAFSSWWMFHSRGMDRLAFRDAVAENEQRIAERPLADDEASRRAWSLHVEALSRGDEILIRTYLDSGYYARQLRQYFESFAQEQVLVVFSDELRRDGEGTLKRVWQHIGVAENAPIATIQQANEAIGTGGAGLLRILKASGLMRVRHLLPDRVRAGIKRGLSAHGDRATMDGDTRARLVAHFLPHVIELEQLLAVNLPEWKR